MSPSASALIGLVNAYRWLVSPVLGTNCRYSPSCSEYAIEALRRHGAGRGLWMALRRVGALPSVGWARLRSGAAGYWRPLTAAVLRSFPPS